MTIPVNPVNVGTTGVLPDPRSQALASFLQAFQTGQQMGLERQQLGLRREELKARTRGQSIDMFAALSRIEPSLLDTETGQGLLRDAGVDPTQVLAARQKREFLAHEAASKALTGLDPDAARAVQTMIGLAAVAPDLPAAVRSDIYTRMAGTPDPDGYNRFLSTWRVGVLTAAQAAKAARIRLPEGIPADLKARVVDGESSRDREVIRISRAMAGLNTLIDNADRQLNREKTTINERVGGGYYKRTGQFANRDLENQALIEYNRIAHRIFPKYRDWQREIAELQDQLVQSLAGSAPQSQPSREPAADPDELDRLINESLRRRRATARPE